MKRGFLISKKGQQSVEWTALTGIIVVALLISFFALRARVMAYMDSKMSQTSGDTSYDPDTSDGNTSTTRNASWTSVNLAGHVTDTYSADNSTTTKNVATDVASSN